MRMKNLNNTAFSLLEILLASIIFIISIGGIFATLNAVRAPVANKENALTAAVFGKQVLETLRSSVNAGTYYAICSLFVSGACVDFSLYLGLHHVTLPPPGQPQLTWPSTDLSQNNTYLTYTVSCADGTTTTCSSTGSDPDMARRVDLNINW